MTLFIEIQKKLGIGKVYNNRQNVIFVEKSIDEIVEVLLPLFDKYPLRGSKLAGYNIFKTVAWMIKEKTFNIRRTNSNTEFILLYE